MKNQNVSDASCLYTVVLLKLDVKRRPDQNHILLKNCICPV